MHALSCIQQLGKPDSRTERSPTKGHQPRGLASNQIPVRQSHGDLFFFLNFLFWILNFGQKEIKEKKGKTYNILMGVTV